MRSSASWTMARIRSTSSHRGGRALSPWLQSAGQLEGQRRGRLAEVELVAAEAVEVLGQVGARASQGFGGDRGAVPVGRNLVECARHADGGVEDEQVGDQVVVLDHLALLVAVGRGGQPAAAERD